MKYLPKRPRGPLCSHNRGGVISLQCKKKISLRQSAIFSLWLNRFLYQSFCWSQRGGWGRDPFNQEPIKFDRLLIQPKFTPVRPGKVAHLKRWTSFCETFPVGPNRYPLSFGWMDCALKFPEWYVLAGDLGFPLPPLPPPPPRFPPNRMKDKKQDRN